MSVNSDSAQYARIYRKGVALTLEHRQPLAELRVKCVQAPIRLVRRQRFHARGSVAKTRSYTQLAVVRGLK